MTIGNQILEEAIGKWREEMYLAFKRALDEQRTVEPCYDAISRQAVMRILDEIGSDFDSPRNAVVSLDGIADAVHGLPSVNPQKPKTGHCVLDKIRAEIESMDFDFGDYYDHTDEIIKKVCEVIDKHKAESDQQKSEE